MVGKYRRLLTTSIGRSQTVRETVHRWQQQGKNGLHDEARSGRPRRWHESDWEKLEQWLAEPRRYSAHQICYKLATECQIELGAEQVRRILKKKRISGSGSALALP